MCKRKKIDRVPWSKQVTTQQHEELWGDQMRNCGYAFENTCFILQVKEFGFKIDCFQAQETTDEQTVCRHKELGS